MKNYYLKGKHNYISKKIKIFFNGAKGALYPKIRIYT